MDIEDLITDPNQVISFVGDWHGNWPVAEEVIKRLHTQDVEVIVHVGDFGIWHPWYDYLHKMTDLLRTLDMHLVFVDGNHEDFDWLLNNPTSEDGTRKLTDRIWHLPRGFSWEWASKKFVALGGAHSIDRKYRIPHSSWWPQEYINNGEAWLAKAHGDADVLITHDAPLEADIPFDSFDWIPEEDLRLSHEHRKIISDVAQHLMPRWLFHGHYHVNYFDKVFNEYTQVVGLDRDGSPMVLHTFTMLVGDL